MFSLRPIRFYELISAPLLKNSPALMMMTTMMSRGRFCAVALTASASAAFCVGVERDESKDNQNEHDSRLQNPSSYARNRRSPIKAPRTPMATPHLKARTAFSRHLSDRLRRLDSCQS
jgi:hypothetical protein